jgi:hypothetical protein
MPRVDVKKERPTNPMSTPFLLNRDVRKSHIFRGRGTLTKVP